MLLLVSAACTRDLSDEQAEAKMAAEHAVGDSILAAQATAEQFLRDMLDHQVATVTVAHQAAAHGGARVRAEARALEREHAAELERLQRLLPGEDRDIHAIAQNPEHRAWIERLERTPQAGFDRTFRREVALHHRAEIQRIDSILPLLGDPEVKWVAEAIRQNLAADTLQSP